jgi:hypothetical protein
MSGRTVPTHAGISAEAMKACEAGHAMCTEFAPNLRHKACPTLAQPPHGA